MALAIIFEDDSVAFLDAVTNYSKTRSSNISEHPVDRSSLVTDHVSKTNPHFTVRAVISAGDFHTTYTRPQELLEGDGDNPPLSPESNTPVSGAVISSPSTLLDFLPGSVRQFLGQVNTSSITLDPFRGYTHEIARDRFIRAWEESEVLTVLDYDYDIATGRYVSVNVLPDIIMERFEDNEDINTGDALEATFSFRQIRYAVIKEVDVQIQQVSPAVADDAASEENEGDQTGGTGVNGDQGYSDALREAIEERGRGMLEAERGLGRIIRSIDIDVPFID